MDSRSTIDGFVLTGGASSRMGTDKAHLKIDGVSLADRALKTLASVCHNVQSVGNGSDGDRLSLPDLKVLPDGDRAAIVGVHSALTYSKSEWTAILACDLPFASTKLFEFLISLTTAASDSTAAIVPVQEDGKWQPLCALYRTHTCLPAVESAIDRGDLGLFRLLENIETHFTEYRMFQHLRGAENFFLNLNTNADLERARGILG